MKEDGQPTIIKSDLCVSELALFTSAFVFVLGEYEKCQTCMS